MTSDDQNRLERVAVRMGRRRFMVLGGAGVAAAVLAACGSDSGGSSDTTAAPGTTAAAPGTTAAAPGTTAAAPGTTTGGGTGGVQTGGGGGDGEIKIGFVTPATGALAAFGGADEYITKGIEDYVKDGLMVGGKSYKVTILREDSESQPNTAGDKAAKLINEDAVDLMLVGDTPETTNPVASQCEANGVPCISSLAPWQPWFFGQNGDPAKGFEWTYHFFWGLEDVIATFLSMWNQVPTNKQVGGLFPNDGDGNAWGDKTNGFPTPLADAGYTLVDPGRYENGQQDFTAQITAFKNANCEVLTGVVIPPDFPVFWQQAHQQGYVPKAASVGKALLFPEAIKAIGDTAVGLSSEVWWSPSVPYKSSLTGTGAKELADGFEADTGNQWVQSLGFVHALYEVAFSALTKAGTTDKAALRDAISTLSQDTIVGNVAWGVGAPTNPVKNVAKTKLTGGQWRKGETPTGFELVIVDNSGNPDVPTGGTMEAITA
jgi:branched-chain amino acid transport system substrate-binding protein